MISAYKIADRIAMLYEGRIIDVGSPQEIKATTNPVVKQFITGSGKGPIKVQPIFFITIILRMEKSQMFTDDTKLPGYQLFRFGEFVTNYLLLEFVFICVNLWQKRYFLKGVKNGY